MSKPIDLRGLSRFLKDCGDLFVKKSDLCWVNTVHPLQPGVELIALKARSANPDEGTNDFYPICIDKEDGNVYIVGIGNYLGDLDTSEASGVSSLQEVLSSE